MSEAAEKFREASRLVDEAAQAAPEMDLGDPPAELKGEEVESISSIGYEISNVLTTLALVAEVNGDE